MDRIQIKIISQIFKSDRVLDHKETLSIYISVYSTAMYSNAQV